MRHDGFDGTLLMELTVVLAVVHADGQRASVSFSWTSESDSVSAAAAALRGVRGNGDGAVDAVAVDGPN